MTFMINAGIPEKHAKEYSDIFAEQSMSIDTVTELDRDTLTELGVATIGHALSILKHAKKADIKPAKSLGIKTAAPKPPQLVADLTRPQFRKFRIDWDVYKKISCMETDRIPAQIYSLCDANVQNSIINTAPNFFDCDELEILDTLERIVTKRANPTVHRMAFYSIKQASNESINDYLVRLNAIAVDCEYTCPNCKHDLSPSHIRDQFIKGISNTELQTDILAKAETLPTIETVVKHAQAHESALQDQVALQDPTNEVAAFHGSRRFTGSGNRVNRPSQNEGSRYPCPSCGSTEHSVNERESRCPAWGKTCNYCQKQNHLAKVCRQKQRQPGRNRRNVAGNRENDREVSALEHNDNYDGLIAHVTYDADINSFTIASFGNSVTEIPAESSAIIRGKKLPARTVNIFPDSGASICIAGPQHVAQMSVRIDDLIPCKKTVRAVGGSTLACIGWMQVEFNIFGNITRQPVYICENVDRLYFSRDGCSDAKILPESFPFPMRRPNEVSAVDKSTEPRPSTGKSNRSLPTAATPKNIPKLKEYLIESFPTVFVKSTPFRAMNCKPVHIHLKPDAKPHARHVPIPIPMHWRDQVKADLDKDVENGVIEPVPVGEPVTWCSPMVVAAKKDGTPRRTVDLQKLNAQCVRETHHCEPPFKLAMQIPAGTLKTVIDAKDGYHSIPLDEESRHLTTFITPWGRYRYLRLPQGYVAAGDAYTRRYDEIIKGVERKVKCIDDALLWDFSIEDSFYHTWDFLQLCELSGVTVNLQKFQFCQPTVDFAGLVITSTGIRPSAGILSAIEKFPMPKDLTSARSWFGLVNQLAWAYSNSSVMEPFRDLVKRDSQFKWDDTLAKLFESSKQLLIKQTEEGIRTFDIARNTCLQTDWSKDGIGYLLLQQYCHCKSDRSPLCCKDGWKLVFAGSRFTRGAERNYAPTEGEALSVAWGLEHARMFVLGCERLIISTDHKPLIGILGDRELSSISNTRLLGLKQRTLPFKFTIQHNPGKWHRGPDAVSRNPVASIASIDEVPDILNIIRETTVNDNNDMVDRVCLIATTVKSASNVNMNDVREASTSDEEYTSLLQLVKNGFPTTRNATIPTLREYWSVRDRLFVHDSCVFLDDRVVIPKSLRTQVINGLHAAHQGVSSMLSRARCSVYWPGIDADLRNKRYMCSHCNEIAPSQPREPLALSDSPEYPFQRICTDYFEIGSHAYLSIVDRFTGWIIVYHYPEHARSEQLIKTCRKVFEAYGVAEELSSDGGPQFIANRFKKFLEDWGVKHRISSAYYPQSNGRAEVAVKSAKRIILNNTSADGSLDNDNAARALLQYRNTPIKEVGLSPAQMLLHRQLRDHLPSSPELYKPSRQWLISATDRERAYEKRNADVKARYDATAHPLTPLATRTRVTVQTKKRWDRSGVIVDVLPNRQYRVKVDGSGRVILRNRRYLKPLGSMNQPITRHQSSGLSGTPDVKSEANLSHEAARPEHEETRITDEEKLSDEGDRSAQEETPDANESASQEVAHPNQGDTHDDGQGESAQEEDASRKKLLKALRDIADYNAKGTEEDDCLRSSRLRARHK